jgi:hypothetical protein
MSKNAHAIDILLPLWEYYIFWRGLLLIIQSGQSRAKVGNKLKVPTPLIFNR